MRTAIFAVAIVPYAVSVGGCVLGTDPGAACLFAPTPCDGDANDDGGIQITDGFHVPADGSVEDGSVADASVSDAAKDASAPACAHDTCSAGAALDLGCDPCVTAVCAIEPGCCLDAWDVSCLALRENTCHTQCGADACAHSPCSTGVALLGGHDDACALTVYRVCNPGDGDMPQCCMDSWTETCVTEATAWGAGCL